MEVKKVSISKLKPAKYNPRKDLKPEDSAYQKLAKSLDEFGYVEPIIWNEQTGNVVGGHQRLKILKEQGQKEIMVSVVDLDEQKERALNIALNKIDGQWDNDLLKEAISMLDDDVIDLTGLDDFEIEMLRDEVDIDSFFDSPTTDHNAGAGKSKEFDVECPECGHSFTVEV